MICHKSKPNPTKPEFCKPLQCLWECLKLFCKIISILMIVSVIIILSSHQHRYPRPFLATPPYCSSLLAGPQGYILYPPRAAVCRFELVPLLLLGHVKGSIGEHHLWACPCFSSSSNFDSFCDGICNISSETEIIA